MLICRPYKTFNFKIIFLILLLYSNIDLYGFLFCVCQMIILVPTVCQLGNI